MLCLEVNKEQTCPLDRSYLHRQEVARESVLVTLMNEREEEDEEEDDLEGRPWDEED